MKQLISNFSSHLKQAISLGKEISFPSFQKEIKNVVICGLGGSGIGGTISSLYLKGKIKIPVIVNKDYIIPLFVDENSLIICSSYSGNTEETLSMYHQAIEKNAEVVMITSGGELDKLATQKGHNIIKIKAGLPPRAAFGLSFPQLFFALHKYNLIDDSFINEIEQAIDLLDLEEENIQQKAKEVANNLFGKLPIIYSDNEMEGVAVRLRQQINENAKMLCWHHIIPEMNHNELVGWRTENQDLAVLFFRWDKENYRNSERIAYCKNVIANYTNSITEIKAKGDSFLISILYLIHIGDWISYYLAEKRGVDIIEVDVITGLKNALAEL